MTDFVNGGSVASQQEERLAENGSARDERRDQLFDLVNRPLMMGLAAIQKCYEGPCVQEYPSSLLSVTVHVPGIRRQVPDPALDAADTVLDKIKDSWS